MSTLFLIPARGGSKGVPGKNIKLLGGKPLINYSIDMARAFVADKDICVSTDAEEIMEVVKAHGLDIPFSRPAALATDTSTTYDVCLHALDHYAARGIDYDTVVLMQPTSPFRKKKHVQTALDLYAAEPGLEMVVAVKETEANPYYVLFEENAEGYLERSKKGTFTRRQDCPKVWQYNGALYVMSTKALRSRPITQFEKIKWVEMDTLSSLDIDTQLDWQWGEFLLEKGMV